MPSTLQTEDNFDEVEKRFDLQRLKRDLEKKSLHPITDAPWRYFKGVLCIGDPEKVAKRCFKSSGNIRDSLNKYVKPYLLEVLNLPEQRIVWERVAGWLCDAGYGNLDQRFSLSINWQRVCGEMLKMQQKQLLMSQPLGSGSRRVADVYVRLGLVERKQNEQPRIAPHDAADRWSVLEQEKTTPISHEDFLERVLQPGKPIAIIGEAGAGKTTLLQHIAEEVQGENTKGLPIWIDLADLEPKETLESYLLKKWLKAVLPIIQEHFPDAVPDLHNPSEDLQKSLIDFLNQGRVWLLLNGVDEMVTAIRQPLRWIVEQYQQGWISKARIVLTCRLNVWSSDGERLTNVFEVYRNLDFEPEDVEKFIHKWFLGESERDSLDNLKAELERSNERIKSLIRNPLRLTLLCLTWQKGGDKLPDTKAGLYQRFVDWHYQWNEEKRLTEEEQDTLIEIRKELDRQLGELSKFALDDQESRFRLRESTVKQFLGNPKQKGSLFWWALRLNWLAPIGLPTASEKDADELVYAFFHPTFQEYFAALAIDDWDDFLPREHINQPVKDSLGKYRRYRIFELNWKEVFLLWFGRVDIQSEKKQEFISLLVTFGDSCEDFHGGFYHYQAYFLAASALGQFRGCLISAHRIIRQVVELAFGYINFEKHIWTAFPSFITDKARLSLRETDCTIAVNAMSNLLNKIQENRSLDNTLNQDLILTGKIKLLISTDLESGILTLARLLLKLNPIKQEAIDALRNLLDCQGWVHEVAASLLLQVKPNDLKSKDIWSETSEKINRLDISSIPKAFEAIYSEKKLVCQEINTLSTISLIQRLHESYKSKDLVLTAVIEKLGEVGCGDNKVIVVLIDYLFRDDDPFICEELYLCLKKITTSDFFPTIIEILKGYLIDRRQTISFDGFEYGLHLLWHCAENMSYPDFNKAWHSPLPNVSKFDAVSNE